MLINCPECDLQVSDKAYNCPHCGYPLKSNETKKPRSKKFRRLPNGFGQISLIKGQNLRKPYRAMITVGFNELGRPICKILKPQGYFESYNEAYEALLEYNRNPYNLDDGITLKELYDKWSTWYFDQLKSDSSIRTISSAWRYCRMLYNYKVKEIRARHIKDCIDNGTANINGEDRKSTPNIKGRIKSLMNIMLDYAVEYELVDRNYSRTFNLSDNIINEAAAVRREHLSFSDDEMNKLWEAVGNISYADAIIVQCYMGWRPQELGLLRVEDVDLSKNIIVGGMKTDAGSNRSVPIHSCIRSIIEAKYKEAVISGNTYLFTAKDSKTHKTGIMLTYDKYQQRFAKVMEILGLNPDHKPHDPRKQFVTMAKKYNVDEYAIKRIVGHAITDLTEKVYTDRDESWLQEEIEKIKGPHI